MKLVLLILPFIACLTIPSSAVAEARPLPSAIEFVASSEKKIWSGGRWTLAQIVGRHYGQEIYVYRISCDGFSDWSAFRQNQSIELLLSYFIVRMEFIAEGIEKGMIHATEVGATEHDINFSTGIGLSDGTAFGSVVFGWVKGADLRRHAREIRALRDEMLAK